MNWSAVWARNRHGAVAVLFLFILILYKKRKLQLRCDLYYFTLRKIKSLSVQMILEDHVSHKLKPFVSLLKVFHETSLLEFEHYMTCDASARVKLLPFLSACLISLTRAFIAGQKGGSSSLSQRLFITSVASREEGGGPELAIFCQLTSTLSSCRFYRMLLWSELGLSRVARHERLRLAVPVRGRPGCAGTRAASEDT